MPDLMGNGRHLNVFGCTPVAGLAGKALSFNGNSYLRSEKVLESIPDVWPFRIRFPFGHAQSTVLQFLSCYNGGSGNGLLYYERPASSDALNVMYYNGSSSASLSFDSFFTGYSTSRLDIDIEPNFTASAITLPDGSTLPAYSIRVYRNGVAFGTKAMTTPTKPTAGGYLYIGSNAGSSYFLSGIAEGFAMFSGALSPNEHYAFYRNPSLYEALPAYPDATSLSSQPMDGTIRTSMDSGRPKLRQRFTATPDYWPVQYTLITTQKQELDAFYLDQGGVNPFYWTKPDTGETVSARFKSRPTYTSNGLQWVASFTLEILP
jgi:hypothetical protein